jgi:hypothetical protein
MPTPTATPEENIRTLTAAGVSMDRATALQDALDVMPGGPFSVTLVEPHTRYPGWMVLVRHPGGVWNLYRPR